MTTEEKRKALSKFCNTQHCTETCPLHIPELRCGRGQSFFDRGVDRVSDADVILAYGIVFPENEVPHIKDSGERRKFDTGAVRDIQEGKGRCDLLPLDVVARLLSSPTLAYVHQFQVTGDCCQLHKALTSSGVHHDIHTMILEVSKHFEEGAKKYGEYNWQKGIPTHCYIDSAVRHYLKWLRGDTDEPHDRSFVWNILCCIWTCQNKPELNDYRKDGGKE